MPRSRIIGRQVAQRHPRPARRSGILWEQRVVAARGPVLDGRVEAVLERKRPKA